MTPYWRFFPLKPKDSPLRTTILIPSSWCSKSAIVSRSVSAAAVVFPLKPWSRRLNAYQEYTLPIPLARTSSNSVDCDSYCLPSRSSPEVIFSTTNGPHILFRPIQHSSTRWRSCDSPNASAWTIPDPSNPQAPAIISLNWFHEKWHESLIMSVTYSNLSTLPPHLRTVLFQTTSQFALLSAGVSRSVFSSHIPWWSLPGSFSSSFRSTPLVLQPMTSPFLLNPLFFLVRSLMSHSTLWKHSMEAYSHPTQTTFPLKAPPLHIPITHPKDGLNLFLHRWCKTGNRTMIRCCPQLSAINVTFSLQPVRSASKKLIPVNSQTRSPSTESLDHTPVALSHHCRIDCRKSKYSPGSLPECESQILMFLASMLFKRNRNQFGLWVINIFVFSHCSILSKGDINHRPHEEWVNKYHLLSLVNEFETVERTKKFDK